ncbi:MAG: pantetheine-phosphate adenylyltransferase [Simkaniaceae bacterium]|nr:MAG: pantetheine-phosphate adenylyltransferase [Simkaniaceae bacterium]
MKVIYPGTFDPPTKGHLSIITRASVLFDTVEIAIGIDTEKNAPLFTQEERLKLLQTLTRDFMNVSVSFFEGLLTQHAKELGCAFIVRSLRTYTDFEHERTLAHTNKKLSGIETLFLLPDEEYQSISSTLIRDIARRGEDLSPFIPEVIASQVSETLRARLQ